MKKNRVLTILILIMLSSLVIAQMEKKQYKIKNRQNTKFNEEFKRDKKLNNRIENAIESGLITKEQGDELLNQKKNINTYAKSIWDDTVMTKEEKETLDKMISEFKEKTKNLLDTAMKNWDKKEHKDKFFKQKIDSALKDKIITKKQANDLLKKEAELKKLEQDIWADNKMTKEEHEKLIKAKQDFYRDIRQIFKRKNKILHLDD